jgi:transcription initiation factor TFIIB
LDVNTGTVASQGRGNADRFFIYNHRLNNNERSLVNGFKEITSLSASLELPTHIEEQARYRYTKVVKKDLLQGRSIDAFAAACILTTIREQQYPVTIGDLVDVSPISEDRIKTHRSVLHSEFAIEIQPPMPQHFLRYVISELPVDCSIECKARALLDSATEDGCHIGNHPAGFAAATVYALIANQEGDLNQSDIAEQAGVSIATISRNYQKISNYIE